LIGVEKDYLIQINKSLKTKSNYANVHGYPLPGHLQHDTQLIIYLPTNEDYTKAYNNFIECLNIFSEKLLVIKALFIFGK
ncbi:12508_t:CDS:2, partial [Racocetra persica]